MCIFAYLSRNSSAVLALGCSRFAPSLPVTCTIPAPRGRIFVYNTRARMFTYVYGHARALRSHDSYMQNSRCDTSSKSISRAVDTFHVLRHSARIVLFLCMSFSLEDVLRKDVTSFRVQIRIEKYAIHRILI